MHFWKNAVTSYTCFRVYQSRCSRIHLKWTPHFWAVRPGPPWVFYRSFCPSPAFTDPKPGIDDQFLVLPADAWMNDFSTQGVFFLRGLFWDFVNFEVLGMTFGWLIVNKSWRLFWVIASPTYSQNSQKLKLYELFVSQKNANSSPWNLLSSWMFFLEKWWVPCSILTMFPKDVARSPMGAPSPAMSITVMLVAPSRKRRPSQRFWGVGQTVSCDIGGAMNGAVGVIYFPTHWGSDLEPQNLPNHRVARCFFFVCKNAGKQTSFLYSFFFFFRNYIRLAKFLVAYGFFLVLSFLFDGLVFFLFTYHFITISKCTT